MKRGEFAYVCDANLRTLRRMTIALVAAEERRGKVESARDGCAYLDRIDAELDRRAGRAA